MFFPYIYIAYIYVVFRFIAPLSLHRSTRVVLALALLLVCSHHRIQQLLTGTMFSPEIDRHYVIALGFLYCTFFLTFLMSVLVDAVLLTSWAVRGGRGLGPAAAARLRFGLVALGAALSGYGVHEAIKTPEVKRVELAISGLPAGLDGFKMVQLTDLHTSRLMHEDWVREVVTRTNALQPDLIVITGDLIDGTPKARERDVQPLADLRARHGVIASLGNHEYYFGAERWTREFERLGMRVLINRHEVVEHGGGRLTVAGVTDRVAPRFDMEGPNLQRALEGAPAGLPVVLLSHQPILVDENAQAGVDLQLSGHTHGGMIRGLDQVVKRANGGYVSGLYTVGPLQLYVGNGTGLWNGFPIRLGVPSEITEFILKPAAG